MPIQHTSNPHPYVHAHTGSEIRFRHGQGAQSPLLVQHRIDRLQGAERAQLQEVGRHAKEKEMKKRKEKSFCSP